MTRHNRRQFIRELGLSAAALPFLGGLQSLYAATGATVEKRKRVIFMFSPNGTLPKDFWPDEFGDDAAFELKPMLKALDPFREQMLMLKGVHNKICLLYTSPSPRDATLSRMPSSA